jgi:hypothetical protein
MCATSAFFLLRDVVTKIYFMSAAMAEFSVRIPLVLIVLK